MSEANEPQGVAIVGMAGRFPGAPTVADFWRNLRDGVESISRFTPEELAALGIDPEQLADPRYVPAKGALEDADRFDAAFFGFTPREAEVLDPQHRVFLECAWEALENAGQDPERPGGRIALYAGSGMSSYLVSNLLPNQERLETLGGLQAALLNDRDFFATRAAYELNLRGPSVTVQTACSTSLVAVHMACQSLLSGECDVALAGGVSISSPLRCGYVYQEGSVMSPDGHCRAFDAAAAGAVEGNGCGVVVLKRLDDALAGGDTIYAVVRGSAINNDGSGKVGFTAPSVEGQAEVISESLMMAGVEPSSIGYVEAHGSGTPMGDPIEIAALSQAFRSDGEEIRPASCAIGSVKTNIGHCNTAAGVAGLIKTTQALVHRTLPPSLHFERPNPQAGFEDSPFYVCTRATPWESDGPRRAGVSSFGLGGTNAHVVLEEAPEREPGDAPTRPLQLLVLSARTPSALDAAASRLAGHLEAHPDVELADVAWTLQTGRRELEHRRTVVARDPKEAAAALRQGGTSGRPDEQGRRPVVFLFPGLGDQYVDMARELYETEPLFREPVDLCAEKLRAWLGTDLREVLFSPGPWTPKEGGGPDLRALLRRDGPVEASRLHQTLFAQPACFVVEYALARLLMEWGIEPEAMIGYSLGEYVAACLAGALSLDDALELVAKRAKLIQELPGGAMLAVPLPEEEVRPLLGDGLALSATNGPHFCVAGGPAEAVEALERRLSEKGASCIRLQTTHAFHTPMMEPAAAPFAEIARKVRMEEPAIPYLSNVTGTWAAGDEPGYWVRHMTGTVRFAEGLAELLRDPRRVFLEVGPGATLATLARQHPDAPASLVAATTLRRAGEGRSDLHHLLEAAGRLWTAGVEIDWPRFHGGERRLRVALPTYPFERQRYWIDPPAEPSARKAPETRAGIDDWFWVPVWKQSPSAPCFEAPDTAERWLILGDGGGLGERIAERLRREGRFVSTVFDPNDAPPTRVLHLQNVTPHEPSLDEAWAAGVQSLVDLDQALAGTEGPKIRVAVVGNGLQEVMDGDLVHPAKAPVVGAARVIRQESARLDCGTIDIVVPAPGSPEEERLIGQLLEENPEPAVALRGRRRWVRAYEPVRLPAEAAGRSRLASAGNCLVIAPEQGPGRGLAETLQRSLGAGVEIVTADGPDAVRSALKLARGRGVIYTGGSFAGGLVQLKTPEALRSALDSLRGVQALFDTEERPAFVVLSSSTPALTGGIGQLDLAAAGAFLEALAVKQAATDGPFTVVAHWDPYQWDGWLAAGAAATAGVRPEDVRLRAVRSETSAEALRRLLAASFPRVAVSDRALPRLIEEADAATAEDLLRQITPVRTEKAGRAGISRPYEPPRDELEESLAGLWQELFGIEPLGIADNFLELGGHSLLAIQMATQLRSRFEVELPVTVLFEAPTIAELADVIRRERGGEEDADELERLLALVEGLSPEEALQRMEELRSESEEVAR